MNEHLLQNDNNVYILGAGFSQEAGMPLMKTFFNKMRDAHSWLLSNNRKEEAQAIDEVLDFRMKAAAASYWTELDLENIEHLFSLASASMGTLDRGIKKAISATISYCKAVNPQQSNREHLRTRPWMNEHNAVMADNSHVSEGYNIHANTYGHYVLRLLGYLENGAPKGGNTFITFNYDTLIEEALASINVRYSYGLRLTNYINHPSATASLHRESIQVIKLHGSVNWTINEKSNQLEVYGQYEDFPSNEITPELIPPTWNKSLSSKIYEDLWSSAVEELQRATRIIVIGFSMPSTDLYFKFLLAASLKNNISLREIIFVDPDVNIKDKILTVFREQHFIENKIRIIPGVAGSLFDSEDHLRNIGRPKPRRY